MPKICRTCIYFNKGDATCRHDSSKHMDLVYGGDLYYHACVQRSSPSSCGPEGRDYSPKYPPGYEKLLKEFEGLEKEAQ